MKEDIKKENNEQSDLQNDNLTKDNFLFVLSVEKIDISFLCGCTLFAGIRFNIYGYNWPYKYLLFI